MDMQSADAVVEPGMELVADAFFRSVPPTGGATVSIWIDGELALDLAAGVADPATGRAYTTATPGVIFSCTKGLAALVIARLVADGELPDWDTPIGAVWPEFAAHGKSAVSIGDALAHRAGVPAPDRALTRAEFLDPLATADLLAAQRPIWEPGRSHQYHTLVHGALTAKLVMIATGRTIGEVFAERIADPLDADAWIGMPAENDGRVAHLLSDPAAAPAANQTLPAWVSRAGDLGGVVHWMNTFNEPAVHHAQFPGAGGIATANALASIWSATVTPTRGVRLLDDSDIAALTRPRSSGSPYLGGDGPHHTWGAGVMTQSEANRILTPGSFGHDGAGGQQAFADPVHRVGFAYLSNQMRNVSGPANNVVAALRTVLAV